MSYGQDLSDQEVASFAERVKAHCVGRRGAAARLARSAGVSESAIRNVLAGLARPGRLVVSRVSAALDGVATETAQPPRLPRSPRPTRTATVVQLAAEKAIANDAECVRLRAELTAAESRVRAAVIALLEGAS